VKKLFSALSEYLKKADSVLLILCVISTVYGIVLISSATRAYSGGNYLFVQTFSLILGVFLYYLFSVIDIGLIAEKWKIVFLLSVLFIASLRIFGVAGGTGNRAWIRFLGIGVQPAEVVKIPFCILLAKQVVYLSGRRGLGHPWSVLQLAVHFGIYFALILVVSSDLGSALVYFFIFFAVLFVGGMPIYWFLLGGAAIAAMAPFLWNYVLSDYQKNRILAPYDPSIDPTGLGVTWQVNQGKIALASGQFFGQGLYNGTQTQSGAITQQHTDFIFSVAGEELGLIGCFFIIFLLALIIIRCVRIGIRCNDKMGLLVCTGMAAMLTFQALINIGMCLGLTPVIGLTLPFFSYGGSSIVTLYVAMGIVSGIKMRPQPSRLSRYSSM